VKQVERVLPLLQMAICAWLLIHQRLILDINAKHIKVNSFMHDYSSERSGMLRVQWDHTSLYAADTFYSHKGRTTPLLVTGTHSLL
jgi:hypothetical protein